PAAFFLAGDSTTAKTNRGGGGWGNGFVETLKKPAFGVNLGHNGRTTISFLKPDWQWVIGNVTKYKETNDVFVTIQFGHNDQKNLSVQEFTKNLEGLAKDVVTAGGTPILVTPLTRRKFSGTKIVENLSDMRTGTITAAESGNYRWIDLNAASQKYCEEIGETAAHKYNLIAQDTTHLNAEGNLVFGRMVADLLSAKYPDVKEWIVPDAELTKEIEEGK
ncbi:carbohydrate esterase family 12 protein, partial [Aulographum hederae CBS 113979]